MLMFQKKKMADSSFGHRRLRQVWDMGKAMLSVPAAQRNANVVKVVKFCNSCCQARNPKCKTWIIIIAYIVVTLSCLFRSVCQSARQGYWSYDLCTCVRVRVRVRVCVCARVRGVYCVVFKKKVIHLERALTRTLNSKLRNVKSMWPVTHTQKKQPTWRKEAAMTCTRAVTHYRTSTTDTQWVISKYCFSFEFRRCH